MMLRWVFESIKFNEKKDSTLKLIRQHFQFIHQLVDSTGASLLHIAANHRNLDAAQHIFTLYEQHAAAAPELFNHQLKKEWVDKRDQRGFTAIHYAVFRQELAMVQLLEREGADIYLCSGDGLNCLHLAAQGGSTLLMHYFIGKGMRIGSTDSAGSTALHWACYSASEKAVGALIAWGAELDCQEHLHGATPLHLAVIAGSARIVKWLLVAGCDRLIRNKSGQTARDLALEKREEHLAEIIEDRYSLLTLLNFKARYRPQQKRGFPFWFFISMFVLSLTANMVYLVPPEPALGEILSIANIILGVVILFVLVFLSVSNPGVLRARQDMSVMGLIRKASYSEICYRCNIVRPPRSRHCSICGICVSVYDHHCPWIGNCVGSSNYLQFFIFLLLLAVYLIGNIAYHIATILYLKDGNKEIVKILRIAASVINLLLAFLFIAPVIYLLLVNARNASRNTTSFEALTNKPSSVRLKSKALSLSTQLTDKISLSSKRTKGSEHLEINEQAREVNVLSNCLAMCCRNDTNHMYRATE